jgi:hypothetical protein
MIHIMLPSQYLNRRGSRLAEPHKSLMAAVLRTVVDDCRAASIDLRPVVAHADLRPRGVRQAIAYVASTDRAWPYSFENLCEALGLSAEALRRELNVRRGQVGGLDRRPLYVVRMPRFQ